ncbi:MAG TPA: SGNH/GDSL hydrolase family protein [Candidatus Polarisedimenticolia bacterium]|nr:SGNH/GDSL hydrolase family protein [Candidatus Polarisedimenticolia bacterium]
MKTSTNTANTASRTADRRRYSRRYLFIPVTIALIILCIYNVLIYFAAKKTQRQHLLGVLDHLPPSTDCVFLGNSLIEAGCDATAFQSAWPQKQASPLAVNLGLGATTPVEHYLILKKAFSRPVHIKYVIYGFFDDQLNAAPDGKWEDLVGNRAFSYYFPKEAAAFYAPNSRLMEWRMEIAEHIPMVAERSSLWDRVELFRRGFDEIGMPKQKVNRFGRVEDFNALEAKDVPSFMRRVGNIVDGHVGFSAPIQAIIDLAHQHGAKVFFVEMPMSPRHRETFYSLPVWTEMRAHLQLLASKQDVTYIAASDWVPQATDFEDTVHLNEQGARCFSARLGATLSQINSAETNRFVAAAGTP